MSSHPIRALVAFLVLSGSGGCTAWRANPADPSALSASDLPRHLRLTLRDGNRITIENASAQGDSIVGVSSRAQGSTYIAVAIEDVRRVETRERSRGRTAALVAGVVAGGIAAFLAVVGYMASTAWT